MRINLKIDNTFFEMERLIKKRIEEKRIEEKQYYSYKNNLVPSELKIPDNNYSVLFELINNDKRLIENFYLYPFDRENSPTSYFTIHSEPIADTSEVISLLRSYDFNYVGLCNFGTSNPAFEARMFLLTQLDFIFQDSNWKLESDKPNSLQIIDDRYNPRKKIEIFFFGINGWLIAQHKGQDPYLDEVAKNIKYLFNNKELRNIFA